MDQQYHMTPSETIEASMRSTFHEVSAWDLSQAADAFDELLVDRRKTQEQISLK